MSSGTDEAVIDDDVVVVVAWVGGPTGRGFGGVERRYAQEGIRLVQLSHDDHVPRNVDAVLVSSQCDTDTRRSAFEAAKALEIPHAQVSPQWSHAVEAVHRIGLLNLVQRRRKSSTKPQQTLTLVQQQKEEPMTTTKTTPPTTTTLETEEQLRALLGNLSPALLEVVLKEAPKLERRREAQRVAKEAEALDEDGAVDFVIALSREARLRLSRALSAA